MSELVDCIVIVFTYFPDGTTSSLLLEMDVGRVEPLILATTGEDNRD